MPAETRGRLAKNISKLEEKDEPTIFSPYQRMVSPSAIRNKTRGKRQERPELLPNLETVRVSISPTTVVTANGQVQTNEEVTVYVKELDLFVTVKLLEDTPAVLSLGKLCEDHG